MEMKNQQQVPEKQAGFLSSLCLSWLNGLIKLGNQRPLTEDDLFGLSEENKAEIIVEQFDSLWKDEVNHAIKTKGTNPRLWKTMFKFISPGDYLLLTILKLLESLSNFSSIVLLWMYLNILHERSFQKTSAYIVVLGIGLSCIMKALTYHHANLIASTLGMRLKIACTCMVYKKILASTRGSLSRVTEGLIFNLVSNESQRLHDIMMCMTFILNFIITFSLTMALACVLVGWQTIPGPLFVVIVSFSMSYLSKVFSKLTLSQALATDKRLTTLNDIIAGIRAVKMYAWEWNFRDKVKNIRRKEITILRLKNVILSILSVSSVVPVLAATASILTMMYFEAPLNAVTIFTAISLVNNLSDATELLNYGTRGICEANVSVNRIEKYLLADNAEATKECSDNKSSSTHGRADGQKWTLPSVECLEVRQYTDDKISKRSLKNTNNSGSHVKLNQISSVWTENLNQCALQDVSLNVLSSQLLMVTGPVGSGKTTLLMTILRQIPLKSGTISTEGRIAYASQIPWIFTGTVRDNILFGKEYDEKRYQRVLEVCDLSKDLSRFPKGDLSMVGQRGVILSGGQRARVGLARAVYSDAEILLLDDPLSAVDAKVGKHIFDKCICEELSGKIRIVVTHQLQHLHRADEIVVLKEGRIADHGTYTQINKNGKISKMLSDYEIESKKASKSNIQGSYTFLERSKEEEGRDMVEEEEDRKVGTVSWKLYWEFFRTSLPTVLIIGLFLLLTVAQAASLAPAWWLKVMAKMSYVQQRRSATLGIYGGIVAGCTVIVIIKSLLMFLSFARTSEILHDRMTEAILKSPVVFFDTNPLGRIINRFSKDVGAIDNQLPYKVCVAAESLFQFFGVLTLVGIVNYWFLLVMVPTVVTFIVICSFYLKPARELFRMEAIRCSPVYEHAAETIKGLEVIQSSEMEDSSLKKLYEKQNQYTRVFSLVISTSRWVGQKIDLLCALFVTAVGFGSLFISLDTGIPTSIRDSNLTEISFLTVVFVLLFTASTALIMTYAISVMRVTSVVARYTSEVETQMTSVERVIAYTKLTPEPGYDRHSDIQDNWPNQGALSLRGVSLSYVDNGSLILKDIDLEVQPREKVGIAGRTGAGKSSLVAALFRMPDPEGQVLVDGVDLGQINVQDARRCMAVITQEPVLFEGSLLKNLDPFDQFTEDEIWTALKEVQLMECVRNLDGRLHYSFGEGGSGFSVGERQLLCLARALLQRRKILILDEATANVDYRTDQLIQQVIRDKFSDCTVLTIAHRLNTIIDYDRVVVLDGGRIVEDDSPGILATKSDGIFARLLQDHGHHTIP